MEAYPFGSPTPDGYSLPIDYWVEGWIKDDPPKVGERLMMTRHIRNGVEAFGVFITSPIMFVSEDGMTFHTKNSIYEIKPVKALERDPLEPYDPVGMAH